MFIVKIFTNDKFKVDNLVHEFFADKNIMWIWTKGHNGQYNSQ